MNAHTTISNTDAREAERRELLNRVAELARTDGEGRRSIVATYRECVVAAGYGTIDTEKDPKTKKDDAALIYEHYVKNFAKKNQVDSVVQQTSKLRTFITVGAGMAEGKAAELFDDVLRTVKDLRDAEVPVKPDARALVDVFTAQKKDVHNRLTDDEIASIVSKDEKEETAEGLIKSMLKKNEKLGALTKDDVCGEIDRMLSGLLGMVTAQKAKDENDAKMREIFRGRGYSDDQIDAMLAGPEQAAA